MSSRQLNSEQALRPCPNFTWARFVSAFNDPMIAMEAEGALVWTKRCRDPLTSVGGPDPSDEPSTTPKLNRGALEKLLGFFDSFAIVTTNKDPEPSKMVLWSD
jgi:hypothetical protein